MDKRVGPQLLTKCATVDAQNAGGLALIAVRIVQHGLKQRPLNFADHEIVEITWSIAIEAFKILIECVFGMLVQRFTASCGFERRVILAVILGHVGQILLRLSG